MRPLRIVATATAIEACIASGALSALGLAGTANGWLDLVNCLAPLIGALGLAGAAAILVLTPRSRFRTICLVFALGSVAYAIFMTAPDLIPMRPESGARPGAPYRIVSANVFRDNVSPLHAVTAITDRGADALLLEEADSVTEVPRSRVVLDRLYPFATRCPGSDVEIRVRTAILAQGCGLVPPTADEAKWREAFVWARVSGRDGRPLILAAVHLERPYPPVRQALQREVLAQAIRQLPTGEPVVLAGDFNTVPWTFGMRRQDELLNPLRRWTRLMPTYPAQVNLMFKPWDVPVLPIDHVYASRDWSNARISRLRAPGSDHFALQADLVRGP